MEKKFNSGRYSDSNSSDRGGRDSSNNRRFNRDDSSAGERRTFGDRSDVAAPKEEYAGSAFVKDKRPRTESSFTSRDRNTLAGEPRGYRANDRRDDSSRRRDNNDRPSFGDRERRPSSFENREQSGDRPKRSFNPNFDGENRRRDFNPDRKPFGERSEGGERRPYGDRTERKPFGERREFNTDRKPFGERSEGGERRPYGDRTERKPFGERREFNTDRKPFGERSEGGERRPYGDRTERKPFGERREFNTDRKPFGDRRSSNPDRRPYASRKGRDGENRDALPKFDKENYPKFNDTSNITNMRLNRFISISGICSRREADELIKEGLITVNGVVVTELGTKIDVSDEILYNGNKLTGEKKVYIVMNKPKGYVTTVEDPNADKTIMELIEGACTERVYPVGRLDKNSLGVLLITNDGDLTKKLTHPSFEKKKIYHVLLDKNLKLEDMQAISDGIELEDGPVTVDEISYVGETKKEVGVEIHSGRNRVVRRIFEQLGYEVEKLDRVYFAGLTKKSLPRGHWRFLTSKEVSMLKSGIFE